jgi:hypothetical protein
MKPLIPLLFVTCCAYAQTAERLAPDCVLGSITFTAVGNSVHYDNRPNSANQGIPCTEWMLQWSAQASVTSLTIQIRGAGDANGTPAAFSAIASGTTFPSGKVSYSTATGYFPWMQVRLNAVGGAGTVNATLLGWKDNAATIASGGGGGGAGCPGTTTTPCVVAGWNGATAQILIVGTSQADVTLTAATDVVLVSGTAAQNTYIPKFDISWDNAADVSIRNGTGVTCGTGTVTVAGPYKNLLALFEDYGFAAPLKTASAAQDVCLHFSVSITGGGQVFFAKF